MTPRTLALAMALLAVACNKAATDPDPTNTLTATDEQHLIALNGYPVDTQYPELTYGQLPQGLRTSDMSNALRSGTSPAGGLYLMQFNGPVRDEALAAVRATGAEVISYIPFNAYVIRASSTAAKQLIAARLPDVQFLGDYEPGFRLSPELRQSVRNALNQKVEVVVQVVDGPTSKATEDALATLAGGLLSSTQVDNLHNVHLMVSPQQLDQIAAMRDVFGVEQRTEKRILDEAQGQIVAGNVSTAGIASGPGYLSWLAAKGFTSAQFTSFSVEVADDTYTLQGHPDLPAARVAFENNPTAQTGVLGGHGFLNSQIIGGFNSNTGTTYEDSRGYNYGLGIAPFAKVGITAIFGSGSSTSTAWEDAAYAAGARISSNSWGYTGTAAKKYDAAAQEYDKIVRDAQAGAAGNQQMIVVFAAGNDGSGAGTVSSPATAKNIITVGASENVRQTGTDGCATANSGADSANDIIGFSSRGPVNSAGGDGRVKPDLVAPGTHIEAGIPQSNYDGSSVCNQYWPAGQTLYGWSSGTSHSCPAVAGGAALVYQDHLNKALAAPSPAMAKAELMNSASYMNGVGANDTLPSNNQGMGRMNLGRAFDTVARVRVDQTQTFANTGETYTVSGTISDTAQPFRVTLAWTDAPGPTTGAPWVNNLDLEVTVNGTLYRGNVFSGASSVTGGTADAKNNAESVFLPAGTSGSFVVTVKATNIAGDGVPGNADTTDQDFALIVYNGSQGTVAPAIGASPTSFSFSGAVGGANPVSQSLSISNTGGGTLTWSASSNQTWLSLSPTSGTAPSTSTVSVNTAGLAAGTYNGAITITATGASNSPVSVPVTLTLTAPDTTPPTTSVTAPTGGATVSGNVTLSANASDNVGVTNVQFFVDGTQVGSDSTSPYSITWDSTTVANGSHSITSKAFDAAGNSTTSAAVSVTVSNTSSTAVYDATLKAPKCGTVASACDTGTALVLGRGPLGPEPNQSNTINASCSDGTSGTFHSDESVDQVTVTSVDGTTFAAGKQVRVDVKVWAYSTFSSDKLDLYYTANASSPTWTLIGTLSPTVGGAQTLSATYTLPTGSLQAVRAAFRYSGTATACSTGSFDDRDDLIFAVGAGTPDTTPPTVSVTAPTAGATVSGSTAFSANASDNVGVTSVELYVDGALKGTDTSSPYSITWDTTTATNGTHSLTAKAYDAAGNSATSTAVSVTVNNTSTQLVVNGGFEGGSTPWVLSGSSSVVTTSPRTGTGVLLEGNVDNGTATTYQTLSIPSTATGTFTFWLNVVSSETTTTTQYDKLFVEVRDTAGTLLTTLATYSNLDKGTLGVYSQKSLSLAAYKGQTIRLQFRATTDVSLPTSFRVDDVSVK